MGRAKRCRPFQSALAPLRWLFEYTEPMLVAQCALSAFTIWASVQFMRLRRWSLHFYEITNWLTILVMAVLGLYFSWAFLFGDAFPQDPKAGGPPGLGLRLFVVLGALAGALPSAALPVLFAWFLRSRYLRPHFVVGPDRQ